MIVYLVLELDCENYTVSAVYPDKKESIDFVKDMKSEDEDENLHYMIIKWDTTTQKSVEIYSDV